MFRKIHKDIVPLIDKIVHKIKLTKVIEEYERTTYIKYVGCVKIDMEKSKYNKYGDLPSYTPIKTYTYTENDTDNIVENDNKLSEHVYLANSIVSFCLNLSNHEGLEYINDLLPNVCMKIELLRVDSNHVYINSFNHRLSIAFQLTCESDNVNNNVGVIIDNRDVDEDEENSVEFCPKSYNNLCEVDHKYKDIVCIPLPKRYYFSNGNSKCDCKWYDLSDL